VAELADRLHHRYGDECTPAFSVSLSIGARARSRQCARPSSRRRHHATTEPGYAALGPVLQRLNIDDPRWATFVEGSSEALPFHRPEWAKLLSECYGFRPFVLACADEDGVIHAGLPALEVSGPLRRGRRWISLPFTDYCPPLGADAGEQHRLWEELESARRRCGISQIQVRAPLAGARAQPSIVGVLHRLALDGDPMRVFATFNKKRVQRRISTAERKGVVIRKGASITDLVDIFYGLHLKTRRRLGVPIQPRRYFRLLWNRFIDPGLGFVLLAYAGETPISGAVFLGWNGTLMYKYSASLNEFWSLHPNHLVIWDAIRFGCESGYRIFDFGLTEAGNEGLRSFKGGWGTVESNIVYSAVGGRPPNGSLMHVGHVLGPLIRRSPPWFCRALGEVFYRYAA